MAITPAQMTEVVPANPRPTLPSRIHGVRRGRGARGNLEQHHHCGDRSERGQRKIRHGSILRLW